MILEFKLASDSLDSSIIPDFSPENILYYLNVAQEEFVKTRYSRNNLYKAGFQEIQKRTDDLNNITKTYFIPVTSSTIEENTYRLVYSTLYTNDALSTPSTDKYLLYLSGQVKIVKSGCPSKYIGLNIKSIDDRDQVRKDPFKRADMNNPIGYFVGGGIEAETDGTFTISKAKITILKKPVTISNDAAYAPVADCELAEHTHREIIELAVRLAVGDVKPEKLEVKNLQSGTIE
jgi:hypothetical protein